jgi:hypothetical protein
MIMSPAGLGTKKDCAGEAQQQLTRQAQVRMGSETKNDCAGEDQQQITALSGTHCLVLAYCFLAWLFYSEDGSVYQKRWQTSTRLHGVTPQNIALFVVAATRTSDRTGRLWVWVGGQSSDRTWRCPTICLGGMKVNGTSYWNVGMSVAAARKQTVEKSEFIML